MSRQTSIDCYNQIKAGGLLSKRRLETFEALVKIAPCTASEVQNSIIYNNGGRDCIKRISELKDRGVIYEVRTRPCKITGKSVIEWDLTDNLPIDVKKPITKKDRVETTLDAFRELYTSKSSTDEDWVKVANLIKSI